MDLDRGSLLRLQEFVTCVNRAMNAVPRPVPPQPADIWDGALMPTRDLHLAYSRLPPRLQAAAANGYALCLGAFDAQSGAAQAAQIARFTVFIELTEVAGLTPEELCPNLQNRGERPYLTLVRDDPEDPEDLAATDADEALRQSLLETVAAHTRLVPFSHPDDAPGDSDDSGDGPDEDDAGPGSAVSLDAPAAAPAPAAVTPLTESPPARRREPTSRQVSVMLGACLALAAAAVIAAVAWPRSTMTPSASPAASEPTPSVASTPAEPSVASAPAEPTPSVASTPAAPASPSEPAPSAAAEAMSADASAFTIDRTVQDGDLTVIVSHGERIGEDSRAHVHMVNAGETARRADITVHHRDHDTPESPEVIPPHSSRRRVIDLGNERDVALSIGGVRLNNVLEKQ